MGGHDHFRSRVDGCSKWRLVPFHIGEAQQVDRRRSPVFSPIRTSRMGPRNRLILISSAAVIATTRERASSVTRRNISALFSARRPSLMRRPTYFSRVSPSTSDTPPWSRKCLLLSERVSPTMAGSSTARAFSETVKLMGITPAIQYLRKGLSPSVPAGHDESGAEGNDSEQCGEHPEGHR